MKTLNRPRVRTVEHQRYTIPADQVTQHIQRVVPRRAIVHYWYEVPESTEIEEATEKATNPEDEVKNPQLRKFLDGIASFGGLTDEDVVAMKKHSQEFRDNNPLS